MPCCECLALIPKRFIVLALLTLGLIFAHVQRTNIGVAEINIFHAHNSSADSSSAANRTGPVLTWERVGLLNSAGYFGYFLFHIPVGFLTMRFQSRWVLVIGAFASAAINIFMPMTLERVVAKTGNNAFALEFYWASVILRIIQGGFESCFIPSAYALIGKWAPHQETSRFGTIALAGVDAGAVLGFLIGGLVLPWNWCAIFWLTSGFIFAWAMIFITNVHESPCLHPTIQESEVNLIEDGYRITGKEHLVRVPWEDILTSLPVWSLCACNFARNWTYFFLLSSQSLYMKNFFTSNATNQYFGMLPHICLVVTVLASGVMADALSDVWSTTTVRKSFNTIGFVGCAGFILALAYTDDAIKAVVFLTMALGIFGLSVPGWQVNHLDIAPAFSGVLVGLSQTVGTIGGFISPLLVGFLVTPGSLGGWQLMFQITAGMLLAAALFFLVFGSGEHQSWAKPQEELIELKPKGSEDVAPTNIDGYDDLDTVSSKTNITYGSVNPDDRK